MLTKPKKFTGVNADICETAWDMIRPAVEQAHTLGVTNKLAGTIIVVEPTNPWDIGSMTDVPVMFRGHVGANEMDDYIEMATKKASLSWRTGKSSRDVQQNAPHLYLHGDAKWGGSVVRDGLIVAFSGVQAVLDEMIAGWMADAIIGLCRHEMTRPDGVMASENSFLKAR